MLPRKMRALQIDAYVREPAEAIRGLRVVERDVPVPGPGQILVKIEAASCNPADLLFLTGTYNVVKSLPAVPGFEGCGTVVAAGSGFLPWLRKGQRVVCGGQKDRDGTWAEYFLTEANAALPLGKGISPSQGAFLLVTPLTAVALLDLARRRGSGAVVQTAAASQVCAVVRAVARQDRIAVIDVVRQEEQAAQLRKAGAQHVLCSSRGDFDAELTRLASELGATTAFDAVSGEMPGRLLDAMPEGAQVVVYGTLSSDRVSGVRSHVLQFHRKSVIGFNLGAWIVDRGMIATFRAFSRVQRLARAGEIQAQIREEVGLDAAAQAIAGYQRSMGGGKIVLRP